VLNKIKFHESDPLSKSFFYFILKISFVQKREDIVVVISKKQNGKKDAYATEVAYRIHLLYIEEFKILI